MVAAVIPAPTASRRRLTIAALIYVGAWLVGLTIASTPSGAASGAALQDHITGAPAATLVQSLLVHGIAGAALLAVAVTLGKLMRRHLHSRLPGFMVVTGSVAAVLSWVQVALRFIQVVTVDESTQAATHGLSMAIDRVDSGKLVAIATLVAAATIAGRRAALVSGWLAAVGWLLSPLLLAGASSFLIDQPGLTAALYASLPLLLLWVAATGVTVPRRSAAAWSPMASTSSRVG
jgi:hypothetical protein